MVSDLKLEHLAGHAMAQAMFPFTFGIVGDASGGREGRGLGTGIGVRWRKDPADFDRRSHDPKHAGRTNVPFFYRLIIFKLLNRQHLQT
jgi:hypothetical protein